MLIFNFNFKSFCLFVFILHFTFQYMIHLELIFVKGSKFVSRYVLLLVDIQGKQQHVCWRPFFDQLHCLCFYQRPVGYVSVDLFPGFLLCCTFLLVEFLTNIAQSRFLQLWSKALQPCDISPPPLSNVTSYHYPLISAWTSSLFSFSGSADREGMNREDEVTLQSDRRPLE